MSTELNTFLEDIKERSCLDYFDDFQLNCDINIRRELYYSNEVISKMDNSRNKDTE